MGKDSLKSISPSRLYSPWQLTDSELKNSHANFGLLETSMMDESMTNTILQIEREQQARIERNREEDDYEDKSLLNLAKKLDIRSSTYYNILQNPQNPQIHISQDDQALINIFSIPKEEQLNLVTLEEFVVEKGPSLQVDHSLSAKDQQVRKVYTKIGEYLGKYHTGKLPKAFKIIPSLPNWHEILLLTKPSLWTPQATYEATKAFLFSIKATQTKQFFELVLLPNMRSSLSKSNQQQLEVPLFLALQKSILKCPALFIKGFLFPLCESKSCTVLEASAVARVITSCHIPVLHSATALLKLSEIPFTLSTSILILVFLEKKQALPYRVVDALVVKYFTGCQSIGSTVVLPQIWFHSLYIFIQSYGVDLVPTQERKLLELIRSVRPHSLSKLIEESITVKGSEDDDTEDDEAHHPIKDADSVDMVIG